MYDREKLNRIKYGKAHPTEVDHRLDRGPHWPFERERRVITGTDCGDCGESFTGKKNHKQSNEMPFLCETCAEYKKGGY